MTTAVRATPLIPRPRTPERALPSSATDPGVPSVCRAVAYQRVLHQVARREWRLLADLATWASAGETERTATLTRHADLLARVLLHHHDVERRSVWPALLRAAPADQLTRIRTAVDRWTDDCARVDNLLRDIATTARQWQVTGTARAREGFAAGCLAIADAVDTQTAAEEATPAAAAG